MSRRTSPGLSRERVVEAGLNLVDREGVGALTMRRLGRELGVEAMSLYGYVTNKQDLLDGVVDRVYGELVPPDVEGSWQAQLREAARSFRRVLLRHPNTVNLVAARPIVGDGNLAMAEGALGQMRACGLDLVRASQVVTVVISFTVGHVASEVDQGFGYDGDPRFVPDVDPRRFPNVAERCMLGPLDRDASFVLGLDFVVAGAEQLMTGVLATN
ncbi:MAG: TetR/AcrR family transcriptional regulator C-terminal domain-containing protein [Acidimicrobiales bacterium]